MFEAFLVAALLTVSDPIGDAVGNGTLRPPTSEVYRSLAPFDLRQVVVTDDPQLTLRIEMGSLSDPFDLPLGFSLPVIEIYVGGRDDGRNELLPGSGMRLPEGRDWSVAVRLSGEQAAAYRASATAGGVESAPASVTTSGNELIVETPFPRPERPRVYAMTGLYDLFGATPWRPLETQESPWAFSSESQVRPVIDVLVQGASRQAQAIEAGILPPARNRASIPGTLWLVLMAVGLLVALAGVGMRILARPRATAVPEAGEVEPAVADSGPVSWQAHGGRDFGGERDEARKAFTWDSSALLTEPAEEELDEELEHEFGSVAGDQTVNARYAAADAWQRPVPLPLRPSGSDEAPPLDGGEEPEVVRDEEETGDGRPGPSADEAAAPDAAADDETNSEVKEAVDPEPLAPESDEEERQ